MFLEIYLLKLHKSCFKLSLSLPRARARAHIRTRSTRALKSTTVRVSRGNARYEHNARVIAKIKQNDTRARAACRWLRNDPANETGDEKLRIFVPLLDVTLARTRRVQRGERESERSPLSGDAKARLRKEQCSRKMRGGNVAQVHDRPLPNSPPLPLLPSPSPSPLSLSLSLSLPLPGSPGFLFVVTMCWSVPPFPQRGILPRTRHVLSSYPCAIGH